MTLVDPLDPITPLGHFDCFDDQDSQSLIYDPASMEIQPGNDTTRCVIVASYSRSAGPFMSRDLTIADCVSTKGQYKQWIILD